MNTLLVLLVLPASVLSKIYIDITPASKSSNASVRVSGTVSWPITEIDQEAFHVTDREVCEEKSFKLKSPRNTLVRANSEFDHEGLTVTLKPVRAEIVSNKEEPVVVALKEFSNHISIATVFKGDVTEDVSEVMTTSWSTTVQLNTGKNICLRFGGGRIVIESAWMENTHHSTMRAISNNSGMEMTLQPGQEVQAVLKATKASLQVKVDYEVSLEGTVCVRFTWVLVIPEKKCWNIHKYLDDTNLPHVITASETIDVGYYYSPDVVIKDKNQIYGSPTLL